MGIPITVLLLLLLLLGALVLSRIRQIFGGGGTPTVGVNASPSVQAGFFEHKRVGGGSTVVVVL